MSKVYDVIVLGAGPAGLAAGLYAGRSRLSTLVIEKGKDGGQKMCIRDRYQHIIIILVIHIVRLDE